MTAPLDDQHIAEAVARDMAAKDRVFGAFGIAIVAVRPGEVSLSMTVREDMLNGHDICHGGVVFTLADTAFAMACNSSNQTAVAAAVEISFVAAAENGEVLTAQAFERVRRRRTGIYDITVTGRDGRLIALARGHAHRIAKKVVAQLPSPGLEP